MTLLLGIDVGGTKVALSLGDVEGGITARRRLLTPATGDARRDLEQIAAQAREVVEEGGASLADVAAIGVSLPGPLDAEAGVLLSPTMARFEEKKGTEAVVPYTAVQNAGIPVAFHSDAEEGAADLPMAAAYAVSQGLSPAGALRALTHDAAKILSIDDRVGSLAAGKDGDVLLLDGSPLDAGTSVLRAWVNGVEVPR